MSFVPNTDDDRKLMLEKIGVSSFEELIENIPDSIRLKKPLDLPPKLSEYEVVKLMQSYANKNKDASNYTCYLGGGAYDHFIPTIVSMVLERPEFKTAYTPYQAEVSQGTLQAMYEYQSMICTLTGMDVSNASLYDGGSAMAESVLMAYAHNKRNTFIYAGSVNPQYKKVASTISSGKKLIFKAFVAEDGTCDLEGLKKSIDKNVSAVIVQQPNFYGNLEDVQEIEKLAHSVGALFVVSVDPISLGVLQAPGEYNADVVIGEGQSLGIPLSFGGPYLGLFAAKQEFVRKIPGRLSGVTKDTDGNRGFVLTLQTREQQIKREKATSNICTNQGLFMLAATAYMATMGKQGIKEVAEQCLQRAHYLASKIKEIKGFSLLSNKPFFKEFLVKTPVPTSKIIEEGEKEGILAGIDTSRFPECKQGLLIAVTEKRSKEESDKFAEFLKRFAK
ncbi:MAG: aminomethyl-transferring glycine dehydrogenase subunit GcvPA [Bacteroidetes bacterium]|nr:MAG: aminomethyl-transferring glycine dehydrogenase subunit GcvPA [Bacteroidota bacterium]